MPILLQPFAHTDILLDHIVLRGHAFECGAAYGRAARRAVVLVQGLEGGIVLAVKSPRHLGQALAHGLVHHATPDGGSIQAAAIKFDGVVAVHKDVINHLVVTAAPQKRGSLHFVEDIAEDLRAADAVVHVNTHRAHADATGVVNELVADAVAAVGVVTPGVDRADVAGLQCDVVVVLNIGGVCETASWKNFPDAILVTWQPGQEGGYAITDVLKGTVNPSGKLPDSFPVKFDEVPSAKTFPGEPAENPVNSFYKEGIYVGYRYYQTFNVPISYEFGFGLSYTTFDYSNLKLSATVFSDLLNVTVQVKNAGSVSGKEVVELYLSAPTTGAEKPAQELKGFAKTQLLKPGESETLSFELNKRSLASFQSGNSAWVADKGDYQVRIGASSKDIRLKDSFNLPENQIVEIVHDVMYPNFTMEELSQHKK